MKVKFSVDAKQTIRDLEKKNISRAANKVLRMAETDIKIESQNQVPVSTGELHDSFYSYIKDNELVVGYKAPYALAVHENVGAFFLNGKAKFLEDPLRAYQSTLIQNFTKAINEVIK